MAGGRGGRALSAGRTAEGLLRDLAPQVVGILATAADTDWPQVLALYGLLEQVAPSPFVTLARAVALAEVEGPDAAVPVLDRLEHALATTSGCTR